MFTSLLKIGLLSLLSVISPLKAVSSYNESTADNEVNFKTENKKDAIVFTYPSGTNQYVQINYSDEEFLDNLSISYGGGGSGYNNHSGAISGLTVYYSLNGVLTSFEPNYFTTVVQNGYFRGFGLYNNNGSQDQLYTDAYLTFFWDNSWQLYIADYQHYPSNVRNLDFIRIYYGTYSGSTYASDFTSIYNGLKTYIGNNTKIALPYANLNNVRFTHLANVIKNYDSYLINNNMSAIYGATSLNNAIYGEDYISFGGDYSVKFYFDGGTSGVFFLDGSSTTFERILYITTYNSELYNLMVNAISSDIQSFIEIPPNAVFEFNLVWNFNAPYGLNIKSMIVQDGYFTTSEQVRVFSYHVGTCKSNGFVFDYVKLTFKNANGYYIPYTSDENGTVTTGYTYINYQGYGFFEKMEYYNSLEDDSRTVYSRNLEVSNDSEHLYLVLSDGSWVNSAYRTIGFYNDLADINVDSITALNDNTAINNIVVDVGNSLDLGDSFSLINLSLSGIVSFAKIQILPGITLGALILIPFAVSLMLFIIGLFKR